MNKSADWLIEVYQKVSELKLRDQVRIAKLHGVASRCKDEFLEKFEERLAPQSRKKKRSKKQAFDTMELAKIPNIGIRRAK